jgi:hypothetical protein
MPSHHFAHKKIENHLVTLNNYLSDRELKELGVPQSTVAPGHPANTVITKETGIPQRVLDSSRVHKIVMEWVAKIGYGDLYEQPIAAPLNATALAHHYRYKVNSYLGRLKSEDRKIPENPEKPGYPHIERIASECGIPPTAFRAHSTARLTLEEGIKELGLQVYVNDPLWTKLVYGALLDEGGALRAKELDGKPYASQQRYNTVHALRKWMGYLGLSGKDFVGAELLDNFNVTIGKVTKLIEMKSTRSKFASEMRRWCSIHRELLKSKGLPSDFRSALEMAIERAGLNSKRVGELAGGSGAVINDWIKGYSLPSGSSFDYVSRIESALKLAPDTLLSLVAHRRSKRFRLSDYPEFTIQGNEKIPLRSNARLLTFLRPLLPDDFNKRSMQERQEMVDWLIANLIGPTSDWGFLNRSLAQLTYSLKEFLPPLEQEWQSLAEFKCSPFTPPGMKRGHSWSPATKVMRRRDFERIFGSLALPVDAENPRLRGLGLRPELFSLTMFICPAILQWWIEWKGRRRSDPQSSHPEEKYTNYEASLVFIISGLFDKDTGWIRQRPDLSDHLQLIPGFIDELLIERAKRHWNDVCDEAFNHYIRFAEELERKAELIRDPFEPILPLLESENPIQALRMFAQNIFDDIPDAFTAPLQAARGMRDYLTVRLLSETALRSKNIIEITYRDDNKGELRKENGKWVLEISYTHFKNQYSRFFGNRKKRHNYKKVLIDRDNLYKRLEEYVEIHRPLLLQGAKSEILLVVSSNRPRFTSHKFHRKYRILTMKYLAYNPYLGRGVPGVKPHGPHTVRDIIATYVIKITGSYEAAAYAIGDNKETVENTYARFMPKHKLHFVEQILAAGWGEALPAQWPGYSG